MHRRAFLGVLGAAAAGLVLDPERLLWVPGQKTIFLPPEKTVALAEAGDVEALLAGLGGPMTFLTYERGRRTIAPVGLMPAVDAALQHLTVQEYRLIVECGRKILAAPRVTVVTEPRVVTQVSHNGDVPFWTTPTWTRKS